MIDLEELSNNEIIALWELTRDDDLTNACWTCVHVRKSGGSDPCNRCRVIFFNRQTSYWELSIQVLKAELERTINEQS